MRKDQHNIIQRHNNMNFNVRNITLNYKILIFSLQNIRLFLKNLNAHLTDKEKILTLRFKNIILTPIIIILSFTNITLCSSNIFNNSNVTALDYQGNVDMGFTFLPKLSITLSNPNLTINNLIPGDNAVDSNTIAVNVSTNIAEGYNLYAAVGSDSSNNTNNGYNTTNLVNAVDNNYTFIPLSSNISELSNFTNNTWGYSYSLDSGTTWISGDYNNASIGYNGLPLYTDTGIKLVEEADNTSSTVDFKIAAKASSTQPSGIYTGTITFVAVSKVAPMSLLDSFIASGAEQLNGYYKMQDMTHDICNNVDVEESELQLIDVRDNKIYWVAKLKDGNCWMTQNLDLDLSSTVALTSETSNIDPESYGKTIYTAETGYSKDETTDIVSWLPSTMDGEGIQRADTIVMNGNTAPGWADSYNNPYSANPGNRYLYTNSSTYIEKNYTSLQDCISENDGDYIGCQHSHFGNYYNWPVAVASNNAANASGDQTNSICPKNWNLPANGRYGTLMQEQDVWSGTSNTYVDSGFNKLRTFPLYFQLFGFIIRGSIFRMYGTGYYLSSTVSKTNVAYSLNFDKGGILPNRSFYSMDYGFSVRCMVNAS